MATHLIHYWNLFLFSIASSPNGWTDMELGSLWLELIFEPQTKARLTSPNDFRLLILDGHNSHGSLKFLGLAEQYGILILCLPPHTTHALQPCDVGVFGPLSGCYRREVNKLSKKNMTIRKENLLHIYGLARNNAFKESTIKAAFRKCGIHPFNPNVLPDSIFAPSLTTTWKAALPIPVSLPRFIETIPAVMEVEQLVSVASDISITHNEVPNTEQKFQLKVPALLPSYTNCGAMYARLTELHALLGRAEAQISADHALKILMEAENAQLRSELHHKSKEKDGTRAHCSSARLLTYPETQMWSQILRHKERLDPLHVQILKAVTARVDRMRAEEYEEERRRQDEEKEMKEIEREAERERRELEKLMEREQRSDKQEAERQRKEDERKRKDEEREMEKAQRDAKRLMERERKAEEKEAEKLKKAAQKVVDRAWKQAQRQVAIAQAKQHVSKKPKKSRKGEPLASLDQDKENTHLETPLVPILLNPPRCRTGILTDLQPCDPEVEVQSSSFVFAIDPILLEV